ncbi:hypothetical protein F5Y19DRAFT_254232 [Xylariaceae sp. FL1651]|nr:hypothetical protein F5Y19DRAFT_254232 [Xylariaceae sp. FL1651]
MVSLPPVQDFHARIADILSIPSLSSYARALSVLDEVTDLVSSSPDPSSPLAAALLYDCEVYRTLCCDSILRLSAQAALQEREAYKRRSLNKTGSSSWNGSMDIGTCVKQRRQGVLFQVDGGGHIGAVLEALSLKEFLEEQDHKAVKKVRWVDQVQRKAVVGAGH